MGVFLPGCSNIAERSPDGFCSICQPLHWPWETGNLVKVKRTLVFVVRWTWPKPMRDCDHRNLIKNTPQYWTPRTFPCMLICLRHTNLLSVLRCRIAGSAKEHVNGKRLSIMRLILTFFLLALVTLSLGHLGHKKFFYLKSLVFNITLSRTYTFTWTEMCAFVLALLDTSTLSGLAARGRPTVTCKALNFLIYQ